MAISWGPWDRGNQGNGLRVGIEVVWGAVSNASTSATATVRFYVGDWHHYNDSMTLNYGGSLTNGSYSFTNTWGRNGGPTGDYRLVLTRTYTYAYPAGSYGSSPHTAQFIGNISGAYDNATPSQTYNSPVPARPIKAPAAPSNLTLTYLSDSQARVTWTRNSTAGAPYTGQQAILYTSINGSGGVWDNGRVVANVSGSATSYVVSGLSANHIYGVHVRASNSKGWSADGNSNFINTTPAAPTGVKAAVASGGGSIVVSGSIAAAYDKSPGCAANIQRSVNAGAWETVASGVQLPWTDTAPGAGANQYRAQTISLFGVARVSGWVNSNTVSTIVPPNAPTLLSPNGSTVDLDDDQAITWQHNDGGDGAAPTAFRVQAFNESSALVFDSGVVNSAVSSFTLPGRTLANGRTYGWAVSDQGVPSEGFGPWSSLAYVTGSTAPTVALTAPTDTLTTGHLTAAWNYAQAQGSPQAQAELTLYDADGVSVLERGALTGTDATYAFATYLENAVTYKLVLQVMSAAGVWASASVTFTVSIPDPADVTATYVYDPLQGQTVVHLEAVAPAAGQAEAVAASLDRSVDGGATWVRLADAVTLPVDFLDPLPDVAGQNLYRVTAISAEPAYRAMDTVTLYTPSGTLDGSNPRAWANPLAQWVFISWGPAFTQQVRARSNPDLSERISAAGSLEGLLSGGLGMAMFGDSVGSACPVKVSVLNPMPGDPDADYYQWDSDLADWRTMAREATIVCLRDMTGVRIFGTLRAGGGDIMSIDKTGPRRSDVSFTVTESRFKESYGAPELGDIPAGALRVADNGDGTWSLVDQSGQYLTAGSDTWQMSIPS